MKNNSLYDVCQDNNILWDYEKNKELEPKQIFSSCRKIIHLKCQKQHEFTVKAYSFFAKPTCPTCYIQENNITVQCPELMKWWDWELNTGIEPKTLLKNSNLQVYWKCPKCAYSWQAKVMTRVLSKGLCPCCEVHIVKRTGFNDIVTVLPELAEQFHPTKNGDLKAEQLFVTDLRRVWWHCKKCNTDWQTGVSARITGGYGNYRMKECPYCAGTATRVPVAQKYPQLRAKYVHEKNQKKFDKLLLSDKSKYLWHCNICNEDFPATVAAIIRSLLNNTAPQGCIYCAGKAVKRGKSFAALHPELMDEFDTDNEIDPYSVSERSSMIAKWHCRINPEHKWEAEFRLRAQGFKKCPFCDIKNYSTMLKDFRPDLEKYFLKTNKYSFERYSYMSNEIVSWKCDKGHIFEKAIIYVSRNENFRCPICDNLVLAEGENDLLSQYPEIASWFDTDKNNIRPNKIIFSDYNASLWWSCPNGHSYQTSPHAKTIRKQKCPICTRQLIVKGINDLQGRYPGIEKIWDYEKNSTTPDMISDLSIKRYFFKCNKGHKYSALFNTVRYQGVNCLVCENKILLKGVNSFAVQHPELLPEWSTLNSDTPDDYLSNAAMRKWWTCPKCNNNYQYSLKMRKKGDNSCPYCAKKLVSPEFNSIAALYPELVSEWSPNNKNDAYHALADVAIYRLWICPTCRGEYSHPINGKVPGNTNCPYCQNQKVLEGYNSLHDIEPELLKEWSSNNKDTPKKILPSYSRSRLWICPECNGEYSYPVKDKIAGNENCPYCKNKKVLEGYNSLQDTNPELLDEWNYATNYIIGALPTEILAKESTSYWWKCKKCGYDYKCSPKRRLYYRKRNMNACPFCKGRRQNKHHFF